jgi:DNA-binding response OmpR family regulator
MDKPENKIPRILVVEDDDAILTALRGDLEYEGFAVTTAQDGRNGLEQAVGQAFDLIILDILLPRMNGYEVCRKVRERGVATPILMLTAAKTEEADKVTGFELGADDYVTKPFGMRELMARVKALLRRGAQPKKEEGLFRFADVAVDFGSREVRKKGRAVHLTALEFDILRFLIERKGRVVTRDEILDTVWDEAVVSPRSIDPHIVHLRRKLEDDPASPRHIVGVRSVGYKFLP